MDVLNGQVRAHVKDKTIHAMHELYEPSPFTFGFWGLEFRYLQEWMYADFCSHFVWAQKPETAA